MASGFWIHRDIFKEATGVVGKIEQAAELILGSLKARFIVIVLLAGDVHAEFESVGTPHPAHRIAKREGILRKVPWGGTDRKSTRLNSSHRCISYAVFCLKK